jgi:hypothetical protein
MSKGNTFETELLNHVLNNAAIADVGNAGGLLPSSAAGSLYLSLHTADPGEAGTQTTSEIAYTSYARAAVSRAGSAWTVTNGTATLAANVDFPAGTGGSGTATHFALGTAASGTGKILYKGAITPNIVTGNGVTPRLTTGTTISED